MCEFERAEFCSSPGITVAYEGECSQTPPIETTIETCGGWPCPENYDPVCGNNDQTYGNDCELERARDCDPSIEKLYDGGCGSETTLIEPTIEVCGGPCPPYYDPLCGNNGETYGNDCEFQNAKACHSPGIYIVYRGECDPNRSTEIPSSTVHLPCGDWECPADWAPVCGSDGSTFQNQCHLDLMIVCRPGLEKWYDGVCYQPTTMESTTPEPTINDRCNNWVCSSEYKPVCGNDGVTYQNVCEFIRHAECFASVRGPVSAHFYTSFLSLLKKILCETLNTLFVILVHR